MYEWHMGGHMFYCIKQYLCSFEEAEELLMSDLKCTYSGLGK